MTTSLELRKELKKLSETLSQRTRAISTVVIAIWWATLVGEKVPSGLNGKALLGAALCAAISFVLDLFQYMVGYRETKLAFDDLEHKKLKDYKFDPGKLLYRLRSFLFYSKQVAAIVAVVWLIIVLIRQISL